MEFAIYAFFIVVSALTGFLIGKIALKVNKRNKTKEDTPKTVTANPVNTSCLVRGKQGKKGKAS